MTVNPELAILMRVIEDHQDKMPEGEYLEAMNALGALHREATAVPPARAPLQLFVPAGHPPSYAQATAAVSASLAPLGGANISGLPTHHSQMIQMMGMYGYNTWNRVTRMIPEHRHLTAIQWVALTQEEQNSLNREATLKIVETNETDYRNPDPKICPFIARHTVGPWAYSHEHSTWTCACGYHGKSKNWQRHEQSERHQDWAQHRIVPRRTIEMMKSRIVKDERGEIVRFNQPLSGGIRYYLVSQERNEWTHPELYSEIHRAKNGNGEWFVHHRDDLAHHYVTE